MKRIYTNVLKIQENDLWILEKYIMNSRKQFMNFGRQIYEF